LKNNLIIFPDNRFIEKEDNNIFIDKYCFDNYLEANNFEKEVFQHDLNDRENRINSFNHCDQIFNEVILKIKESLNKLHHNDYDVKYYEILLGAWLRKFIQQFYFKYNLIKKIFLQKKINKVKIFDHHNYNFYTSETHTIQAATNDFIWSANIYSYIIENLSDKHLQIKKIKSHQYFFNDIKYLDNKIAKITILHRFLIFLSNSIPNFAKLFIYNFGISALMEKNLEIKFLQIPRFYQTKFFFNYSTFDKNLRKEILIKFVKSDVKNNKIINLIIGLLKKSLPLFIIEDYKNIKNQVLKKNFPKKPKYILTSFAFESNEIFKFYLASQKYKNKNLKYIVNQHGNSYITKIDNNFVNEYKTCDKFISWGNKKNNDINKIINFYNFKILNKKFLQKNNVNKNKFLVILRSSGYKALPYDRYLEGDNQLNFTLDFLINLPKEIKSNVIIRAHTSSKNKLEKYQTILNQFSVDYGTKNYFETLNEARMVYFSYDSTGFLELLGLNKPAISAWPNLYQHLNYSSQHDYEMLKNAKILFDDKNQLLEHIINIWANPEEWWGRNSTQTAIKNFNDLYSRNPDKKYLNDLKKIIVSSQY